MDELLKILKKDGRATPKSIAKQLNCSEEEVLSKIKDYEDKKVILSYKAVINTEMMQNDDEIRAHIEVKVKPETGKGFDGIAEKIYRFTEVKSCTLLSGTFDFLLEVSGANIHTISQFVSEKLSQIDNVQSTVTHFILKKYKEDGIVLSAGPKDSRMAVTP